MAAVLDHPGQVLALTLMVLGVVGFCAAVVLLWRPAPGTERAAWLLAAAAGTALIVGALLF